MNVEMKFDSALESFNEAKELDGLKGELIEEEFLDALDQLGYDKDIIKRKILIKRLKASGWLKSDKNEISQSSPPQKHEIGFHSGEWIRSAPECGELYGFTHSFKYCTHGVDECQYHWTCCGSKDMNSHCTTAPVKWTPHNGEWLSSWPACATKYGLSNENPAYCIHGVNNCRDHWTCCGRISKESHCPRNIINIHKNRKF